MTTSYDELARKIWTKCEQERWFGGELRRDMNPEDDPQRYGFVSPPVSEEQIQDAEKNLGFPLPPFLRYLYTRIANGGFGPGLGLYRIPRYFNRPFDHSIVGYYHFRTREQTINLTEYPPENLKATEQKFWRLPLGIW